MSEATGQSRVFVSHSHHDNDYCRALVSGLRERGLTVWYDEHNLGWGQLRQTIDGELANCHHFIAVLSPNAIASDWVNMEIDAALAQLRRKRLQTFMLVVAHKCPVPLTLESFKRIEGPNGSSISVDDAIVRVIRIIEAAQPTAVASETSGLRPQPAVDQPYRTNIPENGMSPTVAVSGKLVAENNTMNNSLSSIVDEVDSSTAARNDARYASSGAASPSRALGRRGFIFSIIAIAALVIVSLIILQANLPHAVFTATPHPQFTNCERFDATSSAGHSLTYTWNFGDSASGFNTATGSKVDHCFSSVGGYDVTLTVRDAYGNTDTFRGLVFAGVPFG